MAAHDFHPRGRTRSAPTDTGSTRWRASHFRRHGTHGSLQKDECKRIPRAGEQTVESYSHKLALFMCIPCVRELEIEFSYNSSVASVTH